MEHDGSQGHAAAGEVYGFAPCSCAGEHVAATVETAELAAAGEDESGARMASARRSKATKCLIVAATAALCLVCFSCAPAPSAPASSDEPKGADTAAEDAPTTPADASMWSMDIDCGVCHQDKQASTEDSSLRACTHATQAGATCITCHSDESTLSTVHQDATAEGPMPKKLKKTTVDAQTCQASGCHDMSADEFKALTADVTELVDSNGTMVNPHEVMGLTAGHADIKCSDCHSEHKVDAGAATTCISCHHAGVYECNTCH